MSVVFLSLSKERDLINFAVNKANKSQDFLGKVNKKTALDERYVNKNKNYFNVFVWSDYMETVCFTLVPHMNNGALKLSKRPFGGQWLQVQQFLVLILKMEMKKKSETHPLDTVWTPKDCSDSSVKRHGHMEGGERWWGSGKMWREELKTASDLDRDENILDRPVKK